jgi:CRISPR-associated protein Cas2
MSGEGTWLLAYDIACRRRGQRVHYRLKKRALFVQESVAVLRMPSHDLDALLEQIEAQLDPKRDDLRVYRVDWPDGAWMAGPDARGSLVLPLTTTSPIETRTRR